MVVPDNENVVMEAIELSSEAKDLPRAQSNKISQDPGLSKVDRANNLHRVKS